MSKSKGINCDSIKNASHIGIGISFDVGERFYVLCGPAAVELKLHSDAFILSKSAFEFTVRIGMLYFCSYQRTNWYICGSLIIIYISVIPELFLWWVGEWMVCSDHHWKQLGCSSF